MNGRYSWNREKNKDKNALHEFVRAILCIYLSNDSIYVVHCYYNPLPNLENSDAKRIK